MKRKNLSDKFARADHSAYLDVRKRYSGVYDVVAHGHRFEIAISEDAGRGWYIAARSDDAYKVLGEPARALHFRTLREALLHLDGLKEPPSLTR
jgi:hypothetical protein